MVNEIISSSPNKPDVTARKTKRSIGQSQEVIYAFFLDIVRLWNPEDILDEFKHLFISYEPNAVNVEPSKALGDLLFSNNEQEFRNTLKRCCYILINNWETSRNYKCITELVDILAGMRISKRTLSPSLSRLRLWLSNFVNSEDYQQIELFVAKYEDSSKPELQWSRRYTSYLLVPQYAAQDNPLEQRNAARILSQQLKDKFKFELAMYTARSQSNIPRDSMPKNPTILGDEVLRLIKMIVAKRGKFNYGNLANIFLKQTDNLTYKNFKTGLKKYLVFSIANRSFIKVFQRKLNHKIDELYENHDEDIVDRALILRTGNRLIEFLTTEDDQHPSPLFVTLACQENPLNLVMVLLKIILISKNSRTHMEKCIAKVIEYYQKYPEEECKWVINFMEVFNITFTIYAENVHYNLIKMPNSDEVKTSHHLDNYRVFSQLKREKIVTNQEKAIAPNEYTSSEDSSQGIQPVNQTTTKPN